MKYRKIKAEVIYAHASACATFMLVLLHQGVIASSSIFLTETIEVFRAGGDFVKYLFLYFVAMAFPYVPGCLSFILLQRWINAAHRRFVALFVGQMAGRVEIYGDEKLKDRVDSVLSVNSFTVFREYITFAHELASFSLNSILSIFVIGILLPAQLVVGYAISVLTCFLIIAHTKEMISKASSAFENRYIAYSGTLAKGWENLTLGNKHNKTLIP